MSGELKLAYLQKSWPASTSFTRSSGESQNALKRSGSPYIGELSISSSRSSPRWSRGRRHARQRDIPSKEFILDGGGCDGPNSRVITSVTVITPYAALDRK